MADDRIRLREALDQNANALQPAAVVAVNCNRHQKRRARDASVIQAALTRAVAILKPVREHRVE